MQPMNKAQQEEVDRILAAGMPESMARTALRHLIEAEVDGVQRCSRCGEIVIDNRGHWEGGKRPSEWPSGPVIKFQGGISPDRGNWKEVGDCGEVPS